MIFKKIIKKDNNRKKNTSVHFTIYVEDMNRAKQFYSNLFNWNLNPSNSKDFLEIRDKEHDNRIGNFQSKKYNASDKKLMSFECSIEVEDIDNTILTILYNKGTILTPKTEIPQVGWIIKFLDTEKNVVSAIQYYK